MIPVNITINTELRGVRLRISRNYVTLERPGPRGGEGPAINISMADWDVITTFVSRSKAMLALEQLRDALEQGPDSAAPDSAPGGSDGDDVSLGGSPDRES